MTTVRISDNALSDIDNLFYVISEEYDMKKTAAKYISGLFEKIKTLSKFPEIGTPCMNRSITSQYGYSVRRVNYKKMAIIYSFFNNEIVIERIIAQSAIKGLS